MLHHGGSSSKRSVFYGNMVSVGALDKGRLSQVERKKKTTNKTTRDLIMCDKILDRLFFWRSVCLSVDISVVMLKCQSIAILGTYIDKSGCKRFVGNPKALKASQNLGLNNKCPWYQN